MSEAEFDIGSEVACTDGVCGRLTRVVLDPVARAITHLVVEPRVPPGRIVPIDRVASSGKPIELTCTKAEFEQLDEAEELDLLPTSRGQLGYGADQILQLPFFALLAGRAGPAGLELVGTAPQAAAHDRVPLGDVDVRRGDQVHATDGPIGKVEGLVIDPTDDHVTHVLLQEGHLWGEKTVSIPISAVTNVGDGVRVSLSKDEVKDLPSVEVGRPD